MKNPNFDTMPRKELIAYVLAHREEEDAFEILLSRRSPDAEATWYNFPDDEEGHQQMAEVFHRKLAEDIKD
jgi:hypothetical protein